MMHKSSSDSVSSLVQDNLVSSDIFLFWLCNSIDSQIDGYNNRYLLL